MRKGSPVTPDQKTAAIKATAEIVESLIQHTAAFNNVDDTAAAARVAAEAYKTIFVQIKSCIL